MTTVQLVGWDEAKCRPIYRHRQAPLPSLEQQQRQSSFVDINIHPPPIIKSSSLVVSRKKKNKKATKIAMNTAVADSSSHDVVVPGRRKRRDRAILSNYSSNNRQHHERVSLSPSHNIIVTAAASSFNLYHHRRLFNNNNNNDNNNSNRNNYHRRVSFDAATRWTKTRRRYGKNDMGVSSNNNNNMSYTHEIVDDVIFVIDDSFAILPPAAAAAAAVVNCNDGMRMMMEDEEGGEDLVFNENNDGQEGRATTTIDESSRSSDTSTSLLHGNGDGVGEDCDDRRHQRRRKISHDIQRIHREIDPLMMVDHPLRVDQYQCESDHPELLDEVTNSKNDDVEFPEIVQHADELVIITTPSSKKQQRGEEQRQLTDSFSNENESEEDDERYYYELDEYDTPSIFNPTIEDAYLIQGDENVKSQLHNTAIILTQDDDDENTAVIESTGFDDHFAIDETGSTTSRIHPSKGERRRGSTYGDGKPVWKSSKLISSESSNGPRGKIIVGWDDDKGRPIYCTTACESNSLSTNIDDPCLLPSTRSLDESEVKNSTIPKQKQKKKKVYATLFKKTGLSQAVRDEMDIDPPLSLHC